MTSSPYKNSLLEKKKTIPAKEKAKGGNRKSAVKQSQNEDEDTLCLYCDERYSESDESWVACQGECNRWAHYSCAGLDENNKTPVFVCELCED